MYTPDHALSRTASNLGKVILSRNYQKRINRSLQQVNKLASVANKEPIRREWKEGRAMPRFKRRTPLLIISMKKHRQASSSNRKLSKFCNLGRSIDIFV